MRCFTLLNHDAGEILGVLRGATPQHVDVELACLGERARVAHKDDKRLHLPHRAQVHIWLGDERPTVLPPDVYGRWPWVVLVPIHTVGGERTIWVTNFAKRTHNIIRITYPTYTLRKVSHQINIKAFGIRPILGSASLRFY